MAFTVNFSNSEGSLWSVVQFLKQTSIFKNLQNQNLNLMCQYILIGLIYLQDVILVIHHQESFLLNLGEDVRLQSAKL